MEELSASTLVDVMSIVERKKAAGVTVFVLFCGSQLESGQSWCPDCVKGTFHHQWAPLSSFSSVLVLYAYNTRSVACFDGALSLFMYSCLQLSQWLLRWRKRDWKVSWCIAQWDHETRELAVMHTRMKSLVVTPPQRSLPPSDDLEQFP